MDRRTHGDFLVHVRDRALRNHLDVDEADIMVLDRLVSRSKPESKCEGPFQAGRNAVNRVEWNKTEQAHTSPTFAIASFGGCPS